MTETGMYVLMDKDHRHKLLQNQPWPVTEEAVKRLYEEGYIFQSTEADKKRAFFVQIE
jgi:hypothetical protein